MHFECICGLKTELNYPFKANVVVGGGGGGVTSLTTGG